MTTIVFSVLLLTMVLRISNAQNVEIPDTVFLHALISRGVDTNGDSLISYEEAEAVKNSNVTYWRNISDMIGIEAFVNLDSLWYGQGQLTSLDVSNNTALTYLYCGRNEI